MYLFSYVFYIIPFMKKINKYLQGALLETGTFTSSNGAKLF